MVLNGLGPERRGSSSLDRDSEGQANDAVKLGESPHRY
jgi:hypothetical protein